LRENREAPSSRQLKLIVQIQQVGIIHRFQLGSAAQV
jgi:hypothetical protein